MTKYLDTIVKIQAEISNFCNASCVGCRRTDHKTLSMKYELTQVPISFLPLDIIEKCISDPILNKLEEFEFCGTIDEPFAHPEFINILEILFNYKSNLFIRIHTNGAIRDKNFYKNLAINLSKFKNHEVRFSLDGLEESHKLYRNLDFNKILDNAKEFIKQGGNAVWQMLEFPWNKHEIEICENMAHNLKFKKFVVRRDRTISSLFPVNQIKELRNLNKESLPMVRSNENINFPKESKEIICHFQKEKMIFLDWQGSIYPCCFLANTELTRVGGKYEQLVKLFSKYQNNFNNLNNFTLTEILNSQWYKKDLVESWNNSFEDVNSKLLTCHTSCGKGESAPINNHLKIKHI